MEETLYTLLTDADARTIENVEQRFSEEFSAGAPWFD
jgi:hypothetical protein